MKRITSVLLMVTFLSFTAFSTPRRIVLDNKGSIDNRSGFPLFFDCPETYYDDNPKAPNIIIDGGGAVSYYDVEISSPVTNTVEISTQVNGTYDTFSISSLPTGTHVITIESPSGNIFEGTFITY